MYASCIWANKATWLDLTGLLTARSFEFITAAAVQGFLLFPLLGFTFSLW